MVKIPDYHIEQRSKYLEDLGLKPFEYGINWTIDNKKKDLKRWKKQREKYGFDEREAYEVYSIFAEWLYCHLKMYCKKVSKAIDLDYQTVEFEGNTYTENEAIGRILKWTEYFLKNHDDLEKRDKSLKKLQKASRLWSELILYAWW